MHSIAYVYTDAFPDLLTLLILLLWTSELIHSKLLIFKLHTLSTVSDWDKSKLVVNKIAQNSRSYPWNANFVFVCFVELTKFTSSRDRWKVYNKQIVFLQYDKPW